MSKPASRLAVFADLHYTRGSAKLKGRVLREALDAALSLGADGIVCAGDMIGTGTIAEAADLRALFDAQPLPVWFTPGNAELRTPAESTAANAILSNHTPLPDGVILIDSSSGWANFSTLQPFNSSTHVWWDAGDCEKRKLLAVTHVPPDSGAIGLTVAGHLHVDSVREGGACRVLRGLDPDKAIGGPPSFATFVRDADGVWHFEADHEIRGIRPSEWTPAFRDAFLRDLGLSTMYDPFGGLTFATERHIQAVELRHASWGDETRALGEAIARWRDAGGRILSMHLPSLRFANGVAEGVDAIARACETARALGCDRVTLHVPGIAVRDFVADGNAGNGERGTGNGERGTGNERATCNVQRATCAGVDGVIAAYARALAPLVGTDTAIGIENMHMTAGETPDNRNFGYTPEECQTLLADLRRIPGLNIGFHLDIGHARNNAPYSTLFPVGTWYEQLGTECNGMHIHQVVLDEKGQMHNHKPLLGFFDKLIALSSLIMARRDGFLKPAPMFLEVRDGQGPASWSALAALAGDGDGTPDGSPSCF